MKPPQREGCKSTKYSGSESYYTNGVPTKILCCTLRILLYGHCFCSARYGTRASHRCEGFSAGPGKDTGMEIVELSNAQGTHAYAIIEL